MRQIDYTHYPNLVIGTNVEIVCDDFVCEGVATIGNNVRIEAKRIYLGNNAKIQANTTIRSLREPMSLFSMGDESLLDFNIQILVPYFFMGDYSQIFNSCLLSGYKPIKIGHNCWIGQGAILNSAENLTLGNNVRMGGSQIWTHVASGELLEGSTFFGEKAVTLEDDVWLMGFGHLITPGVTLAKKSVVMAGSVVTKSTEPYKTYSGIPAVDVSDKLPAWRTVSLDEKFAMLKKFIDDFLVEFPEYENAIHCLDDTSNRFEAELESCLERDEPQLIFARNINIKLCQTNKHSIFDLNSKKYIKQRGELERKWIKFSLGFRARFIPDNASQWVV